MKTLKENDMNESETSKRRMWLAAAAGAAGLAGAGVAWWRLTPATVTDANVEAFWQLSFDQTDGSPLPMRSFKGRPLLLNFWATWCPPCIEELPLLESIWQQNHSKNLQVLGLAVDQPSSVRRFLAQNQLTFPMGLAGLTGTELARSLGNTLSALPFSVLFGADGRVLARKMGKLEAADLTGWLARLN
jgi:peroxiredoxin